MTRFLICMNLSFAVSWPLWLFLNLPFLANFYKLTGMSGTYYEFCLFFAILCNLFFQYFLQQFFSLIFLQFFFAILCNLFLSILYTYFFYIFCNYFFCKAQLNLQNLEANLHILLILLTE